MLYVERARLIKESSLGQLSAIDDNLELSAEEKMRLKLEAETAAASAAVKEWVRLIPQVLNFRLTSCNLLYLKLNILFHII